MFLTGAGNQDRAGKLRKDLGDYPMGGLGYTRGAEPLQVNPQLPAVGLSGRAGMPGSFLIAVQKPPFLPHTESEN